MNPFDILSKYFWIICIIVTAINCVIYKKRINKYINENPEKKQGYDKLLRGYQFWMSLPWLVMGIGCTFGDIPDVWHFFRPQDGNPYVISWFLTVFAIWIIASYWILIKNGAETLVKYPGLLQYQLGTKRSNITNPFVIKLLWCVCLAGGVFGVIMMLTTDMTSPTIR